MILNIGEAGGSGGGNIRYNSENDTIEVLLDGEWVKAINAGAQWDGVLYDNGNERTNITGGWDLNGYSIEGYSSVAAGTKGSNYMQTNGVGSGKAQLLGIANKVDVSKYNYINIDYQCTSIATYGMTLSLSNNKVIDSSTSKQLASTTRKTETFSLGGLSEIYVAISSVNNASRTGRVFKIWLS